MLSTAAITRLQAVANICVIIAAVVCVLVWGRWYLQAGPTPAVNSAELYAEGEQFPPLEGTRAAGGTLVLFVHSQCRFCTLSMPFYQRLIARRNDSKSEVNIAVLAREADESLQAYLREHSLQPDAIRSVLGNNDVKLRMTPTLLHLTPSGRIAGIWMGQLQSEAEETVIRQVLGEQSNDADR